MVRRKEFWHAFPAVAAITVGTMAGGLLLTTFMMLTIGFAEARLHYTLAIVFPTIITPIAAFPLVVMSQRLQRMKGDLEGLLRLDGLTAIPNRRAFFERATTVFSHKTGATAMMIDIDHFKRVNDNYGHAVGDVVLSAVGHMIERRVAAAQFGGARITARIGGEEFAVLVEDLDAGAAEELAEDILEHVRRSPVIAGDDKIAVTVSIGMAQRRGENTPDELLRVADAACYRAKRLGRDRWCTAGEHAGGAAAASHSPVRRQAAA